MTGLTPKQESFCLRYIETGNASEAYRLSYDAGGMKPESVNRSAKALLDNAKIAARLGEMKARQLKRHDVTIDRVLAEYAKLAFLDIRRAFDAEGNLLPIHELDDDTAAAIAGIEVEVKRVPGEADEELEGQPNGGSLRRSHGTAARIHKLKLSDKKGALDSLAKYLKLFSDGSPVTVNVSGPLAEDDKALLDEYARAD